MSYGKSSAPAGCGPWIGIMLCAVMPCAGQIRQVETPVASLRLAERSGDLVGIRWKVPRLEIIAEPRL
ncbi:MAG TPA: hypothetical protein VME43_20560, partial [Bryobacteraceae bacterium]|nr:hypothetical protein [Bryobacteraceae bacterium]